MLILCISVNFPISVLGDFNLPHIDWSIPVSHDGPKHQGFVEFCINNFLTQAIADPTHCDKNILNFLLCNNFSINSLQSYDVGTHLGSSCDHSSIHFYMKWTVKTSSTNLKQKNFRKANQKAICEELNCIKWEWVLACTGVYVQLMNDHISDILSCITESMSS